MVFVFTKTIFMHYERIFQALITHYDYFISGPNLKDLGKVKHDYRSKL